MDQRKQITESKINIAGDHKTPIAEHIDRSYFQYFKKKIKSRDSENLLNDYKNVCIILLYALLNRTNVTFVTADRDILAILLVLSKSLAHDMTFTHMILSSLSEDDKRVILKRNYITRYFSFSEFKKIFNGVYGDIMNVYWKRDYVRFRVKLWDLKRQKYINDFSLNFNESVREMILNMHGPLSCHFAKNDTYGNWIHYHFWPPPPKSPDVLKVLLSLKKRNSLDNIQVPEIIHRETCKYAIDDAAGRLKEYYGFLL